MPDKFEEELEEMEQKEEELKAKGLEEEEHELQKEKSNVIMSFVSRFRSQKQASGVQEQAFDLEEDLKTVAKITTNVMKMLPPEKLSEYKKSTDFETFKLVLKKRNLIREKQE